MHALRLTAGLVLATLTATCGEVAAIRTVSRSDAVILLSDSTIKRRELAVFTNNGDFTQGKLERVSAAGIKLQGSAEVDFCRVASVRVSRYTAPWWKRAAGIASGVSIGTVVGWAFAVPALLGGADAVGLTLWFGSAATGGVVGYRSVGKRQSVVYRLDEASRSDCQPAPAAEARTTDSTTL